MKKDIIIIGTGPVGIRICEEILHINPDLSISLYGEEPHQPYNRVLLSDYLSGNQSLEQIRLNPGIFENSKVEVFINCRITQINSDDKTLTTAQAQTVHYEKLILATGSHAFIPKIANQFLDGIFSLRTIEDADQLRQRDSKTTLVVGGGLLGLETARALHNQGTSHVIVIDHGNHLMSRQLNPKAGELLAKQVHDQGIEVKLGHGVKAIEGTTQLEAVILINNQRITCDTLVFAIGIRANIEIAKQAGIHCIQGIVVDNRMRTSKKDIYAVGECIEYNHQTYGIVNPGFEQARIAAMNICGGQKTYNGSILSTRLKVLNYPVFSMGRVGENESALPDDRYNFHDPENKIYRHLVVYRGRLIGCIALGDWKELSRIRTAIEQNKRIWGWQIMRFKETGSIWRPETENSVNFWPNNEIVCHCAQVNRGQLGEYIKNGCQHINQLTEQSNAGLTCGSCLPLLNELIGSKPQAIKAFRSLAIMSVISFIAVFISLTLESIPYQLDIKFDFQYDQLWRDPFYKQFSGYSLLACSILVLSLSLRKRVQRFNRGDYVWWRLIHVAVGLTAILILALHTGFRFGHALNFYLMSSFSALLAVGGLAGLIIAFEHKLNPGFARTLRSQMVWLHLLLFWPIPVLLGFHILKTYYF